MGGGSLPHLTSGRQESSEERSQQHCSPLICACLELSVGAQQPQRSPAPNTILAWILGRQLQLPFVPWLFQDTACCLGLGSFCCHRAVDEQREIC